MRGVDSKTSGEQAWQNSMGYCTRTGFREDGTYNSLNLTSATLTQITPGAFHDSSKQGELWVGSTMLHPHDHFKPLSGITSLTLSHISFTLLNFSTLRHTFCNLVPTLRSLRLLRPTACPRTLFLFISIFCNLQDTEIHSPSWDKPCDPLIESFGQRRGELCISEFNDGSFPFLSLLESQATNYERLTIRKCSFDDTRPLQRLVSANGQNMRRIQIVVAGHGKRCLPFFTSSIHL